MPNLSEKAADLLVEMKRALICVALALCFGSDAFAQGAVGVRESTQGRCGIGLDYRSWNGAILKGPKGGLFGVRVGFVENGKLVTGSEFYEQVERSGEYDPQGKYASLTTRDLKLEWRVEGN
jgi:hypothetical protein